MNETYIVTSYYVIDKLLKGLNYKDDSRSSLTGAEILTVAVIAAKYFQNHHERALVVMNRIGDIGRMSVSRFNRRLHALRDWVYGILQVLGDLFAQGEVFIIDSMPMPVCKRVRASRCRKVRGKAYCGYCAAKREAFFGWRLHLICTDTGVPVAFDLLPAAEHDLTPSMNCAVSCRPMPVFTGINSTLPKLMRPPSLTRPVFAWFSCDATTCVPIPGLTISTYAATAGASKPFILSWRVWVCKGFMPVPIPALI